MLRGSVVFGRGEIGVHAAIAKMLRTARARRRTMRGSMVVRGYLAMISFHRCLRSRKPGNKLIAGSGCKNA